MSEHLSDQELQNLFNEYLPPVQMPPHLAAQVRERVLEEVALVYQQSEVEEMAPAVSPYASARQNVREPTRGRSFFGSMNERFSWWRFATGVALTGATVAVLLLFVLMLPQLRDQDPAGGITTAPSDVLAPIEASLGEVQTALLTVSDGQATILRSESNALEDVASATETSLAPRDELVTLNGTADVALFDNQRMVVAPASRVIIDRLSTETEDGATIALITIQNGSARFIVDGPLNAEDHFEVVTENARMQTSGADFEVARVEDETAIEVQTGTLLIEGNGQVVQLAEGQRVAVAPDGGELLVMNTDLGELEPAEVAANTEQEEGTPTPVPTYTPVDETPTPLPAVVEEEPTATPTEEPTATPTEEPTVTPTATPTVEPTATPTDEPTATPTSEPTATPTEEPTVTPTDEPTATPRPTATPTPTETPTRVPVVVELVVPNDGVGGADGVLFDWNATGMLAPNEAYELIFWKLGQDPLEDGFGLAEPTRGTQVRVDLTDLDDRLGALLDPGDYLWGIRVVTTEPEYSKIEFTGESRLFRYAGPQAGGSDGAITGE